MDLLYFGYLKNHSVSPVQICGFFFPSLLTLSLILQLLDLPGIIEGAKDGKGRGRQVIAGELSKATSLGYYPFIEYYFFSWRLKTLDLDLGLRDFITVKGIVLLDFLLE